jgi:hypothetical protein
VGLGLFYIGLSVIKLVTIGKYPERKFEFPYLAIWNIVANGLWR